MVYVVNCLGPTVNCLGPRFPNELTAASCGCVGVVGSSSSMGAGAFSVSIGAGAVSAGSDSCKQRLNCHVQPHHGRLILELWRESA